MERIFNDEFRESDKHCRSTTDWGHFKDHLCYLCLIDSVSTPWFLTHEVASLNKSFNYEYFGTEFSELIENILGNLKYQ